jgi:hypothetical protein
MSGQKDHWGRISTFEHELVHRQKKILLRKLPELLQGPHSVRTASSYLGVEVDKGPLLFQEYRQTIGCLRNWRR